MQKRYRVSLFIAALGVIAACTGQLRDRPTSSVAAAAQPWGELAADHAQLAARRAEQIERLHDYRLAGVYPTDQRSYPIGVFRDDGGHLCPMSFLIHASGHDDLVDHTARTENRVLLKEVTDGPLMDWMLSSGLTQEEIAMVQGAMDIDYGQFRFENDASLNNNIQIVLVPVEEDVAIARMHDEVASKLTAAEKQLRDDTAHSLELAATRLKQQRVATARR